MLRWPIRPRHWSPSALRTVQSRHSPHPQPNACFPAIFPQIRSAWFLCSHVLSLSRSHLRILVLFWMILRHLNICSVDITMNKERKYFTLPVELIFKGGEGKKMQNVRKVWKDGYFFTDWCSRWHYVDLPMLSDVMDKKRHHLKERVCGLLFLLLLNHVNSVLGILHLIFVNFFLAWTWLPKLWHLAPDWGFSPALKLNASETECSGRSK